MAIAGGKSPAEYEERYCAFVDILGFRELIANISRGIVAPSTVKDALKIVHVPYRNHDAHERVDLKFQSISDAVCISTACSMGGIAELFTSLRQLNLQLLEQGMFARGAVVRGQLYHDDEMVFGDALVQAYLLERDVARFPRIVVSGRVADEIFEAAKKLPLNFGDMVRQSDDGPHFVHLFKYLVIGLNVLAPDKELQRVNMCNRIAEQVQARFDASRDNPSHFEKVRWFAQYWNESIPPAHHRVRRIVGKGLDAQTATWG
jgi:hypothetical protein